MTDFENTKRIELAIVTLKQEHRDFDSAIVALQEMTPSDQLQIKRLKKKKLALRDRISLLEDQLTPDIIA